MKPPALHRKTYKLRKYRLVFSYVSPAIRFLVVCALLWGGGYAFSRYLRESGHYCIQKISVSGIEILTPEAVIQASNVTKADNILFLDPREIAARVEKLPRVKTCAVTRIFPDVVSLSVIERDAVATLIVNNRTFEIDESGYVLEEVMPDGHYCGPLITLHPPLNLVAPGEKIDRPELIRALAVWDAFSKTSISGDIAVSELAVYNENDIRMYCDGVPFELRWGRGNSETQARRLEILWKELAGCVPCVEYLDLRFGRDLACK